jgi:hypothetical protein
VLYEEEVELPPHTDFAQPPAVRPRLPVAVEVQDVSAFAKGAKTKEIPLVEVPVSADLQEMDRLYAEELPFAERPRRIPPRGKMAHPITRWRRPEPFAIDAFECGTDW